MKTGDPILLIRFADPVDETTIAGFSETVAGRDILSRVVSTPEPPAIEVPAVPRTSQRYAVAIGLLMVVVVAAAVTIARPTTDPLSAGCYQNGSQQANTAVIELDADSPGAVAACAKIWTSAFGEPVPEGLIACVVVGGGLGVFPADPMVAPDDACAAMGAAVPTAGSYAGLTDLEVRSLQDDLRNRHDELSATSVDCIGAATVVPAFSDIVEEHQAPEWRITDVSRGSECTDFVLDSQAGQVLIIGVPPPG